MHSHPHEHHEHPSPLRVSSTIFTALFILVGLLIFFNKQEFEWYYTFSTSFGAIVLEAIPFMLIGALVGGLIEVFIPQRWIAGLFDGRSHLSVIIASLMGMVFPVCECAIVPIVRRLVMKGIPPGAAVAFLLSGPIVNPIVGLSTLAAYSYDWQVVSLRLGGGLGVALSAGFLSQAFFTRESVFKKSLLDQVKLQKELDLSAPRVSLKTKIGHAIHIAADDFLDISRFLVIGAFIAAASQFLISRQALADTIAISEYSATGFMMMLAIILNLCSEADAFVAATFRGSPIALTPQLAFMITGPMIDIKLLLMYSRLFRRRFIPIMAGMVILLISLLLMIYMRMGI